MTEDEMVGWCHRLKGHEFEQILEIVKDSEAWRTPVQGCKESYMTERLSNTIFLETELSELFVYFGS